MRVSNQKMQNVQIDYYMAGAQSDIYQNSSAFYYRFEYFKLWEAK